MATSFPLWWFWLLARLYRRRIPRNMPRKHLRVAHFNQFRMQTPQKLPLREFLERTGICSRTGNFGRTRPNAQAPIFQVHAAVPKSSEY